MNLKRNINGCRKRESYSVSFFLINQLLMINNPKFPKFPKFSRISEFRAFVKWRWVFTEIYSGQFSCRNKFFSQAIRMNTPVRAVFAYASADKVFATAYQAATLNHRTEA